MLILGSRRVPCLHDLLTKGPAAQAPGGDSLGVASLGFFTRLLIPRSVRRAAHPGRAVKRAITPKAVKNARRALHPIDNARYSVERSIATSLRSGRKKPQRRYTGTGAALFSTGAPTPLPAARTRSSAYRLAAKPGPVHLVAFVVHIVPVHCGHRSLVAGYTRDETGHSGAVRADPWPGSLMPDCDE